MNWLSIAPPGNDNWHILKALLAIDPKDPALYMLTAENALNKGDFMGAVSALERGAGACDGDADIMGVLAALKKRLGL